MQRTVRAISSIKVASIAWALVIVGVCVRLAVIHTPTRQNVFPVYQNAGASWLNGENLYRNSKYDYRYSPTFALAMAPFAPLPLKIGSILWRLFSAGAFLGALVWVSRAGIPRSWGVSERSVMLLLLLPLCVGNVNNGQANLLVLAALLVASAAIARDAWTIATITLVLPAVTKVYPIVFAGLMLMLFPRKLGWRFPLALIVALAVPFAFQHPDYVFNQYRDWLQYLRTEDRTSRPFSEWYSDVRLIVGLISPISKHVYLIIEALTAATLAIIGVYLQRRGWPLGRLLGWMLSVACCWMTVLGPATESSTFVLIAPATAWVVCDLVRYNSTFGQKLWVAAIYFLQLLAGVGAWFGGLRAISGYANPQLLSALLLLGYLFRPSLFRGTEPSSARCARVLG